MDTDGLEIRPGAVEKGCGQTQRNEDPRRNREGRGGTAEESGCSCWEIYPRARRAWKCGAPVRMETRAAAQPGAGFAGGPRRFRGRAWRTTEGKVGRADSAGQRSVGTSQETGGGRFACAEQEDE